jgi:alpha-beta hydrolase superfamily lysophospholipase
VNSSCALHSRLNELIDQDDGIYLINRNKDMAKPCIILVHGAYHQPSHWDLLVELLQSAGYSTFAPKLPSSGASPLPGVFDADVSSVKQAVLDATAKGATSVIPVFHSYGGIPGFEALASLTPEQKLAISRVICISAFVLPKGDSVVGVQESSERTYVRVEVRKPICRGRENVAIRLTSITRA